MHEHHTHHSHMHGHAHDDSPGTAALRTLESMLDHWIEHTDSHKDNYQAWASKASELGEEEIAKELYLAIQEGDKIKAHLKRAKAILAAKLILLK